jgi:itaconyl-CoA hydratase
VTVRTRGRTQAGTTVITFDRTVLLPKRGHGVEDGAAP